jgi:very-short-patch-repair endonuclease/endogenous inhibitor of DNA gyrase (YacG/DUF329 family)
MIQKIKTLLVNNGKIIPQRCNISFLKKHNIYEFINNSFNDSYSLSEKIYCIIYDLTERKTCKICGNDIKFNHGYGIFCSRKCSNSDINVLNKNKLGVSKSLKKAYSIHGDEIKNKRNNTLKERYGEDVLSPFGLTKVKIKIETHMIQKYGVKNIFYLDKYRSNGRKISIDKSILRNKMFGYDIEYIDKNLIKIHNLCKIHGDVIMKNNDFYNRTYKNRNDIQCVLCNPINSFSSFELKFEELLQTLNITNYLRNYKKLIKPFEVDFYFPDYNLAIELNGVYWHSEIYKDKNYHKIKTDLCESKNVRLLQIWEDDFYNKYEIIESMIKHIFKLNNISIYARKCKIKEISSYDYVSFLIENHLQGKINSSIRLGLFKENELVAIMGFGKLRISLGKKSLNDTYELHRFCIKKNYNVVGGASKLMAYFDNNIKYNKLISYAKRDISNGAIYNKLGFSFVKKCEPGYYWLIDGCRKHRFNYRKDKICTNENKNKTEIQIMHDNGYLRCYDSGNLLYEKIKNNYIN